MKRREMEQAQAATKQEPEAPPRTSNRSEPREETRIRWSRPRNRAGRT